MTAADKIQAARALIEPLTERRTFTFAGLFTALEQTRDTVSALADLADAQAQQVTEWREEYRAVQGMNELLKAANAKLIAERDAQAQENARLTEALGRIVEWSEAYPLDVFPEPDFEKVRSVLEASGMTLDAVSASNMRHVLKGAGAIARAALGDAP